MSLNSILSQPSIIATLANQINEVNTNITSGNITFTSVSNSYNFVVGYQAVETVSSALLCFQFSNVFFQSSDNITSTFYSPFPNGLSLPQRSTVSLNIPVQHYATNGSSYISTLNASIQINQVTSNIYLNFASNLVNGDKYLIGPHITALVSPQPSDITLPYILL